MMYKIFIYIIYTYTYTYTYKWIYANTEIFLGNQTRAHIRIAFLV